MLDTDHGWAEIHPVFFTDNWAVIFLSRSWVERLHRAKNTFPPYLGIAANAKLMMSYPGKKA